MAEKTLREQIERMVKDIAEVRLGVPQLFFCSDISFTNMRSIINLITNFKEKNQEVDSIDVILETPGGSPHLAYKLISFFRKKFKYVNIIVPFWTKSAGTLLSLGASSIIMSDIAEFGPLDMQIKNEREDKPTDSKTRSALIEEYALKRIESRSQELYLQLFRNLSLDKEIKTSTTILSSQIFDFVAKFYEPLISKIDPYLIGSTKRSLSIGERYAEIICRLYSEMNGYTSAILIDHLVNEYPDHSFIVDKEFMKVFLPKTIKEPDFFGEDYPTLLKELSYFIMNNKERENEYECVDIIGFIPKEKNKSANYSPTDMQLSESFKRTVGKKGANAAK